MKMKSVLLVVVLSPAAASADHVAKVSEPPPFFALSDEHGEVFDLEGFLGRSA